MLKLRDLAGKAKRLELEWEGEPFFVEYAAARVSAKTLDMLLGLQEQRGNAIESLATVLDPFLQDVIAGWDIVGDDDRPLERTPETLAQLPFTFKVLILRAIEGDQRDPLAPTPSGNNSAAGS